VIRHGPLPGRCRHVLLLVCRDDRGSWCFLWLGPGSSARCDRFGSFTDRPICAVRRDQRILSADDLHGRGRYHQGGTSWMLHRTMSTNRLPFTVRGMSTSLEDDGLSAFVSVRPRLFGIAYRMLGSSAEAEDVLQEVWVRWQTTDRDRVRNPVAFMVTAATRLAINVRQSARVRRETYAGPWLPEPTDTSTDPGLGADRREALNVAVLLLLEKLSPTERAAYILREAFDYPYRKIADVIRVEEANARQLVTRARERLSSARREPVTRCRAAGPPRRIHGRRENA